MTYNTAYISLYLCRMSQCFPNDFFDYFLLCFILDFLLCQCLLSNNSLFTKTTFSSYLLLFFFVEDVHVIFIAKLTLIDLSLSHTFQANLPCNSYFLQESYSRHHSGIKLIVNYLYLRKYVTKFQSLCLSSTRLAPTFM